MNKYIKTDIASGLTYLKIAIMNALSDVSHKVESEIDLGPYISETLLYKCLIESNWILTKQEGSKKYWDSPTGEKIIIIDNQIIKVNNEN